MATVGYDNRSFLIDGRRIWLMSGAIHYFRTPAALWRDRLLKARRAGLNCVETYIAWNFHEPVEGQWDFSGDRDFVEFIRQAGDMGMYAIVRPGPYICAEWDFGGFPAWLAAKSGVQYRTNNAAYTHYYDKYFRQILPRLADLQVSRGGNLVAIQNENEYYMTTMPDRMEYLNFISLAYRRAGFNIPILTCNIFTEPLVDGAIDCNNCWEGGISNIKKLRTMQPEAPLLTTEFWPGWFDQWGDGHHTRDDRESARRALELVGAGSQVNYYMFHGGTNFGFWGGRSVARDDCFMTTSYDYDAPLAEGGALTRKYYLTRLVNLFGTHMADALAAAAPLDDATAVTGIGTLSQAGPAGRVTVVTNQGGQDNQVRVAMPDGRLLDVDVSHFGAVAVVSEVPLTEQHTLDYCNLMPLGLFEGKMLALHGLPGQAGVISINGQELKLTVPADETPQLLEHQGLGLLVMPSSLAERCWPIDKCLVVGPDFVGETLDEIVPRADDKQYLVVDLEEKIVLRKMRNPLPPKLPRAPVLGRWNCVSVCEEPTDGELQWKRLDRPRSFEALGVTYGYGWYDAIIDCARPSKKAIYLPQCEDRATLYVNGKPAGVWGRGEDAQRTPITVSLAKGENRLTLLVDNLGRFCFGFNLGETKGLWGDVYAAAQLRHKAWKIVPGQEKDFSRRHVPRNQLCLLPDLQNRPFHVCTTAFTLAKPTPVHLQFAGLQGRHVAVFLNDHLVGFYAANSGGFGDALLSSDVKKGANRLTVMVWGELDARKLSAFRLYRLDESLTGGAKWRFRPWTLPNGHKGAGPVHGRPAWYSCQFSSPPAGSPPLYLTLSGVKKGQLYLNGRNVGRFWNTQPQKSYYLPSCWLTDKTNELLIFDEAGNNPTRSKLEFMPRGPFPKK